jgi:hypothetical protein
MFEMAAFTGASLAGAVDERLAASDDARYNHRLRVQYADDGIKRSAENLSCGPEAFTSAARRQRRSK